jgi:hypothetical protein
MSGKGRQRQFAAPRPIGFSRPAPGSDEAGSDALYRSFAVSPAIP